MHNIGQWDKQVLLAQMRCVLAEIDNGDTEEAAFVLTVLMDMLTGTVDWPDQSDH